MHEDKKHIIEYVIKHCKQFRNKEERLICDYFLFKEKYIQNHPKTQVLKERNGLTPKVEEAIEAILETKTKEQFYEEMVERIVEEHSSKFNHCPKCDKIARTDSAKQCRFCSHDWH